MPSLIRLLVVLGLLGGFAYGAHFCARHHGRAEAARDHRHDPAGQARQAALTSRMMARAAQLPTPGWSTLFLDMLASERGAAANTLAAYRRDLDDFAGHLAGAGGASPEAARSDDLRGLSGRSVAAGLQGHLGGAPALGDPPALPLPLRRRPSHGRSGRGAGRPEARAGPAQDPLGGRGRHACWRPPARRCRRGRHARRSSGCAPRGSTACWRFSMPPACASPNW